MIEFFTYLGAVGGGYGAGGISSCGGGFGPVQRLLGSPNFGLAGKIVLIYPVDIFGKGG